MVKRALTAMDALAIVKEIKARNARPAFERASSLLDRARAENP